MRRKKHYKFIYTQLITIFFLGFSLGVFTIWPGFITGTNRKCFFNILKDGSDGNIQLKTIISVSPNYLLKIKNADSLYMKVLLIGDSCFRKF